MNKSIREKSEECRRKKGETAQPSLGDEHHQKKENQLAKFNWDKNRTEDQNLKHKNRKQSLNNKYNSRPEAAAPLFVTRIPNGELVETDLKARLPVKVVERAGKKLKELMHKSNPLGSEQVCPRTK